MWRKLTPRKRRVLSTFEWKLHAYIKGEEGEMVLHLVVRGETFYDLVALFMNKWPCPFDVNVPSWGAYSEWTLVLLSIPCEVYLVKTRREGSRDLPKGWFVEDNHRLGIMNLLVKEHIAPLWARSIVWRHLVARRVRFRNLPVVSLSRTTTPCTRTFWTTQESVFWPHQLGVAKVTEFWTSKRYRSRDLPFG